MGVAVMMGAMLLAATLPAAPADAAPLTPVSFTATTVASAGSVAATGTLADMTDGNTTTGLTLTATVPGAATGFSGAFTYDIAGIAGITGFIATLRFIADVGLATPFTDLRLGSDAFDATRYVGVPTMAGTLVSTTLSPVAGGSGVNDLAAYIVGTTLTLAFATEFGAGGTEAAVTVSFREVSLDLVTAPVPVPAPGSLPLFAAFLGALALATRRRA
jgi:hypothetical protein